MSRSGDCWARDQRQAVWYAVPMRIRPATNADREQIRELFFSILVEYGLSSDPVGTDADLDDIEASYIRPGGWFEVVEDDAGTIIGTVGLFPKPSGVCELRKMYLLREARGSGLGKTLMERMLAKARELGFHRMELETSSKLIEAIGLYKRYGFRPATDVQNCARCDQGYALDL